MKGLIAILSVFLLVQCSLDTREVVAPASEASLEQALKEWPEMPQQITFIGLKDCPAKFQVYWNGALSCFVGRDCFGNVFPPQRSIAERYERDQLHMTPAGGSIPDFPVIDSGQVDQNLLDGYMPVIESTWATEGISYSVQTFATALHRDEPDLLANLQRKALDSSANLQNKAPDPYASLQRKNPDPPAVPGMTLALMRVIIEAPENYNKAEVHFWFNFSGYRVLVPTRKELPDDVFPAYGRKLRLRDNLLLDGTGRIRAAVADLQQGAEAEFYDVYTIKGDLSEGLERSKRKGFLNNLLHLRIPCQPGEKVMLTLALPYFPVEPEMAGLLERDYETELDKVRRYWEYFYSKDAVLETPDEFVNDFYRSGLWRTLVTADRDAETGLTYAKSSPAWYETMWPNCTMVSAVSMDMRGQHGIAEQYLEPFLDWQSVRNPPNMRGASKEGFLCPPEAYCAIPWVSNHGNILWALCEHYRFTGDREWAERITGIVLGACEWIYVHRRLTLGNEYGSGMLPGGTVSDDKGSGQYLCSDAQNYRGLRAAADFLVATGHERAAEMDREASRYRQDIRKALQKAVERNDSITLSSGERIPYVPAEIHQTEPPVFDENNFWPYINYIDVGPMHLVDCDVLESRSEIARWILQFESEYPVAKLSHPISLTENWVHTIRLEGEEPASLLHHGVSTIEPFYSPRSTMFLENDAVEDYLDVFYHQLASGVSHRNLAPCENRYGVWHMPWADGEFHRMFLRMLVHQESDKLVLLKAIPRRWLEDGNEIRVDRQPTPYGEINFRVRSALKQKYIEITLDAPERSAIGGIDIRFRHPGGDRIRSVELDGNPWDDFDDEYVYLKRSPDETIRIKVHF